MKHSLVLGAVLIGSICVAARADVIPYGVPKEPWNARWGNHRARIRVDKEADAVRVHVPWRRRDLKPEEKAVWIIDAKTGERVQNAVCVDVNREFGDLIFQAAPSSGTPSSGNGAGEYHVYYMPFTVRGRHFPSTVYDNPKKTANGAWLHKHGLTESELAAGKWRSLPKAEVTAFEARRPLDRMDPMEVIATAEEVERLLTDHC